MDCKIDLLLLPPARREIYDYYRLEILPSGLPAKRMDAGPVFHPILAPYLICDFLDQYEKAEVMDALGQARGIADRVIAVADEHVGDSLVYWYEPETRLSSIPKRFYSGLTQAWYVKAFARLSTYDEKYREPVRRFFESLKITVKDGGPLLVKDYGWIVEEYPYDPPLYTLNGWLTVLRLLLDHKEQLHSLDGFDEFIRKNMDAVQHLLPLYDAGFVANSRYQLTGFTRLKFVFSKKVEFTLRDFSVDIPGEGSHAGSSAGSIGGRWGNYVERREGRILQLNLLLSLVSFPRENVFRGRLSCQEECQATVFLADGDYDPLISGLPTKRWRQIGDVQLQAGDNPLTISLPWDDKNLFAYPTNFKKQLKGLGGKRFNAYHYVHIIDLAVLFHFTKVPLLKVYAERWARYVELWPGLQMLPADQFAHQHYSGQDFFANVNKYLGR